MPFDFVKPNLVELKPRITVIGVGGAGGNAVANMIQDGLQGVDFVVANTDAQALALSPAETRIQLGLKITQGLGAGARPEIGAAAAEEALGDIDQVLEGVHMCFITAGMGGGTGTGAAPVVARAARERGVLTVGVITKPFAFEGLKRMRAAEEGIAELQRHVDTLIVIPNQNLFLIANQQTTFKQAFAMADQVLNHGVRGITDLMVLPGLINLDFADVRTVMSEMGKAMMGTGEADGDRRAIEAAERAISNPLLDEVSLRGAKAVIINITGGEDLGLMEVEEAAQHIREMVDPDANIIVGSAFNNELDGKMRVSVVATGIDHGSPATISTRPAATNQQSRPAPAAPAPDVEAPVAARSAIGQTVPSGNLFPAVPAAHPAAPQPQAVQPQPAPVEPEPVAQTAAEIQQPEEEILELEQPIAPPPPRAPVAELPVQQVRRPEPEPEPEPAPAHKPTLFERMISLSRRPRPDESQPAPARPEPNRDDSTAIPTFFRQQRN